MPRFIKYKSQQCSILKLCPNSNTYCISQSYKSFKSFRSFRSLVSCRLFIHLNHFNHYHTDIPFTLSSLSQSSFISNTQNILFPLKLNQSLHSYKNQFFYSTKTMTDTQVQQTQQTQQEKLGTHRTRDINEPKRTLYPPIEPFNSGYLQVDETHSLFYEESGNPKGAPVVVLHGGPGGGCAPFYRQYFDPEFYHIVLFDQRGSGHSKPHACLENNTTWHLVDDIEKIRKHLGIKKWHSVFGGSWGSTLAVAYAETYPEAVGSLILRGIFLLRREELIFFYQGPGSNFYFPDAWESYLKPIPESQRGDLMFAYYKYLTGNDEKKKLECAKAWSVWEMSTSRLLVSADEIAKAAEDNEEADLFSLAFARIECHYFVNAGFFEKDGQLLLNAHRLKGIPTEIVSGRYDTVCPIKSSWDLHKAIPHSNLTICPTSGHSMKEEEILSELVRIADEYKKLKVE